MRNVVLTLSVVLIVMACGYAEHAAAQSEAAGVRVIGAKTSWRCHFTWGTQSFRRVSGELVNVDMSVLLSPVKDSSTGKTKGWELRVSKPFHTPLPSEDRHAVEFDDSSWQRFTMPICCGDPRDKGEYRNIQLMCLRGKFLVDDPAKVGDLRLNFRYRGGAVVFFNGREIARGHMSKGKLVPLTPAEDYDTKAFPFKNEKGRLVRHRGDVWVGLEKYRLRELSVAIPASLVKKGVNVLSLDVHSAPFPESYLKKHLDKHGKRSDKSLIKSLEKYHYWSLSGVESLQVTSKSKAGIADASVRPKGIQVWNHPVTEWVTGGDVGDACEKLAPVRIVSPLGGAFSGQVILSSAKSIKGLQAKASDLSGPDGAVISASSVEVRWGVPDGYRSKRSQASPHFDGLAETPPAETLVFKKSGASVQPVWITVNTPSDAAPGDYRGKVTLTMEGAPAIDVPLNVRVIDWKLPERPFTTIVDVVQSPDSVAMWYKVPMWSRKHWRLLKKSFKNLGRAGCNSLTVTLIRRTHFGNEHGMVFWTRKPDGSLVADLSIAKRYIDTAVKHLGKVPIVILYAWEPGGSTRHSGGMGIINMDRDILISVKNPNTGLMEEARGPKWGTQECAKFWKPVIDGIRDILARHGISKSLMIGVAGDRRPSKAAVKTLSDAAPYAPWYLHSHTSGGAKGFYGQPIAYWSSVWPSRIDNPSTVTDKNRIYNFQRWAKAPYISTSFPRQRIGILSSFGVHKIYAEKLVIEDGKFYGAKLRSGTRGFGRLGGDFWGVLDKHPAKFGTTGTRVGDTIRYNLSSRYPEAEWQNLGLSYTIPALLSPGPKGAISTVRLEGIREGVQENEALFFLERTLADAKTKSKLGEALATRCQNILDERTRVCMRRPYSQWLMGAKVILDSGAQDRSERIFLLAAEVAGKLK